MSVLKYSNIKRYKYKVEGQFTIDLSTYGVPDFTHPYVNCIGGLLTIEAGYCWDGATCAVDTYAFMGASLVHDALYQMMRLLHIHRGFRRVADDILRDICVANGMSRPRAYYVYRSVRLLGGKFLNSGVAEEPIKEVVVKTPEQ